MAAEAIFPTSGKLALVDSNPHLFKLIYYFIIKKHGRNVRKNIGNCIRQYIMFLKTILNVLSPISYSIVSQQFYILFYNKQ